MTKVTIGDYELTNTDNGKLQIEDVPTGNIVTLDSTDFSGIGDMDLTKVVTNNLHHAANDKNQHTDREPDFPRKIISTEPQDVYVDPGGSDSNPGTSSQPIETVQEAFNRMPLINQHQQRILLKPGTYDFGNSLTGPPVMFTGNIPSDQPFIMRSTTETASDVVVDKNMSLQLRTPEPEPMLRDFTLTGSLQWKDSQFRVDNIIFSGTASNRFPQATSGHAGNIRVSNCEFQNANYEFAMKIDTFADGMLKKCTGSVSKYVVKPVNGAKFRDGGNNTINSPRGYIIGGEPDLVRDQNGRIFGKQLSDDFGDNRLKDRIRPHVKFYRPGYRTNTGSADVNNNELQFPAGTTSDAVADLVRGPSTGELKFTVTFDSDPTASTFNFYPLYESSNDNFYVEMRSDGQLDLQLTKGGTNNTPISGSWPGTAGTYEVRLTRAWNDTNSTFDYELFLDGASQGTASDSYVIDRDILRILNGTDSQVNLEQWSWG